MPTPNGPAPTPEPTLSEFRATVATFVAGHSYGICYSGGQYEIEVTQEPITGAIYINVVDFLGDLFNPAQNAESGVWAYTITADAQRLPQTVAFSPGERGENLTELPLEQGPLTWQALNEILMTTQRHPTALDLLAMVAGSGATRLADQPVDSTDVIAAAKALLVRSFHPAADEPLTPSIYWSPALDRFRVPQICLVAEGYEQYSPESNPKKISPALAERVGQMSVMPMLCVNYQGKEHVIVGVVTDPAHVFIDGDTLAGHKIAALYLMDISYIRL
ncbi:MAG: hypothetical protein K1X79_10090 [Oligoflexia bacterium]|nr:hypothetical protein [Oligoflexia bacterium]